MDTKGERREEKRRAARKMRVHNAARWQQVRELLRRRLGGKGKKA